MPDGSKNCFEICVPALTMSALTMTAACLACKKCSSDGGGVCIAPVNHDNIWLEDAIGHLVVDCFETFIDGALVNWLFYALLDSPNQNFCR
jgi:hypothetical protein